MREDVYGLVVFIFGVVLLLFGAFSKIDIASYAGMTACVVGMVLAEMYKQEVKLDA